MSEEKKSVPTDLSGGKMKKYMNGWNVDQEKLMAKWADIAGCYRWLHDRAEKKFSRLNMVMTIPVIILSTLTGTANFAIGSFIAEDDAVSKRYAQAGIGAVSIFAGILTTLGNFLRYAQGSEAFRVSAIGWGKFQRQIAIEIAIHPNDRMDCMDFLNICRQTLDRLIEQSPQIPDDIIKLFEDEFKHMPDLVKPDICHGLEHTRTFDLKQTRLTNVIGDVVLYLKQKKKMMREEVLPDLSDKIAEGVKKEMEEHRQKIELLNQQITQMFASQHPEEESAPRSSVVVPNWRNLLHDRKESKYPNPIVRKPEVVPDTEELVVDVEDAPNTIEEAKPVSPVVEFK
jgi:hypothetical protein